ncbi:sodium/panthothenate symporter [Pontibacillus yanchengensis]|uniref:Sodium/panthothenate symporter n=2 Tax=Pontibacillus yanchengensis TaxID=462910 RepID=A0ACC7VAV4_9BACI|nr:sodium/pantothenate symporter [Pontibacillus yanchengensis]MYL32888.1 sodium/panthothenate symporter [Pontibacillus yanchengensis]MYL51797.1 sodium/panthothenate symporter [Pontibacillus yanchengensis]
MNSSVLISLVAFLLIIFIIGFWSSRHVQSSESFLQEYFLGNRQLGGFILAMTMTATYGSASSFIGGPGLAYSQGLGWVLLAMSQVVTGYFVLMVLGKRFAILARRYKAVTLIDFLKARYESKWVVLLSAFSIVLFLFSAMAAQWVGGARLIESVTGLSYTAALFIFGISVLVYVVIGGFRAVALTDTVQGVVMFFGTIILLIATIFAGGGVSNLMSDLVAENPNLVTPYGANADLSPGYVSSFWILVGVGVVGLPQVTVRAMSYKSSKAMHRAIIIGTIVVGVIMLNMHLIGVFAKPILPGIENKDTVMPLIAQEVLPPWLAGIVLAAPMAAIMSTVDSLLLLVSSALVKDVYINYINPSAPNEKVKKLSFIMTSALGILVFLLALQPPQLLIWLNLYAFGGLEAAFIWPVVLGLYWSRGNKYGAIASMLTGISTYVIVDSFFSEAIQIHPVVIPVGLSLLSYVIVSMITTQKNDQLI